MIPCAAPVALLVLSVSVFRCNLFATDAFLLMQTSVCLKLRASFHEAQTGLGVHLVSAKPPPPVRLDSANPPCPVPVVSPPPPPVRLDDTNPPYASLAPNPPCVPNPPVRLVSSNQPPPTPHRRGTWVNGVAFSL